LEEHPAEEAENKRAEREVRVVQFGAIRHHLLPLNSRQQRHVFLDLE